MRCVRPRLAWRSKAELFFRQELASFRLELSVEGLDGSDEFGPQFLKFLPLPLQVPLLEGEAGLVSLLQLRVVGREQLLVVGVDSFGSGIAQRSFEVREDVPRAFGIRLPEGHREPLFEAQACCPAVNILNGLLVGANQIPLAAIFVVFGLGILDELEQTIALGGREVLLAIDDDSLQPRVETDEVLKFLRHGHPGRQPGERGAKVFRSLKQVLKLCLLPLIEPVMRPEAIGPGVPTAGDPFLVEPMEIVGIARHIAERIAKRALSVLEITRRCPGLGRIERVDLPQPLVQELPADKQPERDEQHARDNRDVSQLVEDDSPRLTHGRSEIRSAKSETNSKFQYSNETGRSDFEFRTFGFVSSFEFRASSFPS